jgi:hypothetical protein
MVFDDATAEILELKCGQLHFFLNKPQLDTVTKAIISRQGAIHRAIEYFSIRDTDFILIISFS